MPQQTIVAHFDNRSDAQKAIDALVQAGISRTAIRMLPESDSTTYKRTSATSSYNHSKDEGGFWATLSDLFLPDEDRYSYAEGMSRGGVTVSVTTDDSHLDRVSEIVERYGAVDMDEREQSWKREGWAGYAAATGGTAATSRPGRASSAGYGARGTSERGEEVIPIVEEQLRVGKRQVNKGRVRIRSYVVETPVQEQVSLRQEHVHVERRPVNRAATAEDEVLFQDRTIEAEERAEEAVVSKEARVKEELVVKKNVEDRTETVKDKVRRTEVDVDDERTGQSTSARNNTQAGRR